MSDAPLSPSPSRRRVAALRFVLGLLAPFALPFLVHLILGTLTEPWMHGVSWAVVLLLGLVAGLKERSWAFFLGALAGIVGFSAAVYLKSADFVRHGIDRIFGG